MRETKEPDEAEALEAAVPGDVPGGHRRPDTGAERRALPRVKRRRSRRERAVIWTTCAVGTLAGIVLVASLLGRVFLVNAQTGNLAPTPVGQLGITLAPTYAVRHSEPPDLRDLNQAIDTYISKMSLDDELGQMIQVQFVGPNLGPELSIPSYWIPELKRVHVGSIILYWYNIQSIGQVQALTRSLQSPDVAPKIPLMISTDEEGGEVDYLDRLYGSGPTEDSLGRSGNPMNAYNWGRLNGTHLKALGINTDLAPVVDVKTVPNPSIDLRMYGSSPQLVTNMAAAFIDGLHSVGIPDTLKHWPGIGWSAVDAHAALPVSNRSLADLERIDFAPYKALISTGRVDMIMPTHVLLTAIDPNMPSSLSPKIINGILRQQLGFQGVVITDALYMGALTSRYSMAQSAVLAVIAGEDILSSFYDPAGVEAVMAALHHAIDTKLITKKRIDQSVKRILMLKVKYGMWTPPGYNG